MKEQKLIEGMNKIETLGSVVQQIMTEIGHLKTIALGNLSLLKEMPGYKDALETLKTKHAQIDVKDEEVVLDASKRPLDGSTAVIKGTD